MYEKIVIIGSAGAGKSWLAQKLGSLLNIEVIHLDHYFWLPKWKEKPRNIRIEIQQQLVREKEQWIIEGTYLSSSDSRLYAADTIIFLDMPGYLCLRQVIKRRLQEAKTSRPDLPQGCREQLSLPYILKVLVFPLKGRRLLLKKLEEFDERKANNSGHSKKTIHILKSREEVDAFLRDLPALLQKAHTHEEKPLQKAVPILAGV